METNKNLNSQCEGTPYSSQAKHARIQETNGKIDFSIEAWFPCSFPYTKEAHSFFFVVEADMNGR